MNVFISGGSRGIGRGIALAFARAGHNVAINCVRNVEALDAATEEIKASGSGSVMGLVGDVGDYERAAEMVRKIEQDWGSVDVLVNNAGISQVRLFQDSTPGEWSRIIDVNLKGMLNLSHAVIPAMIRRRAGHIINISSIWGNRGSSCEAVYSLTKGGVNSFTQALAKELGPCGIRVNAIACGMIDTEMNAGYSAEELRDFIGEIPVGRIGTVEDIAGVALFLASPAAAYVNGQILTVDGGYL